MGSSLYGLAVELVALMALWLGLSVWQRDRHSPGALLFFGLTLAILVWCAGILLAEHEVVGFEQRRRIIWAGVLMIPPFWFGVAAHASGIGLARRIPWFPAALAVPSILFYGLFFAGPWQHLLLHGRIGEGGEGPLFLVWVIWAYVLTLGGVLLFVRSALRWPSPGLRRRCAALAVAVLIPLAGDALWTFGFLGIEEDPTPVLLGLTVIPLRSAIFQGGLFDVLPVDQRDLLMALPVGIVLADRSRAVIEMNRRAEAILGTSRETSLGRDLESLMNDAPPGAAFHLEDLDFGRGAAFPCLVVAWRERAAAAARSGAARQAPGAA